MQNGKITKKGFFGYRGSTQNPITLIDAINDLHELGFCGPGHGSMLDGLSNRSWTMPVWMLPTPRDTQGATSRLWYLHAVMPGVPLPELQTLMGHVSLETTRIYLNAMGKEKRALVSQMWNHD